MTNEQRGDSSRNLSTVQLEEGLAGLSTPNESTGQVLLVSLDISATNLPVGSRLRVGGALVEVTPKPHNGCAKFSERFGPDALRFVNAKPTRDQNLRGIYWKVIEPGEVAVGDSVEVLSRQ